MLYDYVEFITDNSITVFRLFANEFVLCKLVNLEAVKILDSIGTGIVSPFNFIHAIDGRSVKIVEYLHKRGITLNTQYILFAQNIKAYDIVFYLSENGIEPTTDFYIRYCNFRKKVKARRERRLTNMVYYVLIYKIYRPGSESANRLGWASYNASMEGRVL